nr:unnamed protein product [Meloidogyne enterolobii]
MKNQYDKFFRESSIKIGDRVLLRNYTGKIGTAKKFQLHWKGIYRVINLDGIYATISSCISPNSPSKTVHINQIKKCFEYLGPPCTIPYESEEQIPKDNLIIEDKIYEHTREQENSRPNEPNPETGNHEVEVVKHSHGYDLRDRNKITKPGKYK